MCVTICLYHNYYSSYTHCVTRYIYISPFIQYVRIQSASTLVLRVIHVHSGTYLSHASQARHMSHAQGTRIALASSSWKLLRGSQSLWCCRDSCNNTVYSFLKSDAGSTHTSRIARVQDREVGEFGHRAYAARHSCVTEIPAKIPSVSRFLRFTRSRCPSPGRHTFYSVQ